MGALEQREIRMHMTEVAKMPASIVTVKAILHDAMQYGINETHTRLILSAFEAAAPDALEEAVDTVLVEGEADDTLNRIKTSVEIAGGKVAA